MKSINKLLFQIGCMAMGIIYTISGESVESSIWLASSIIIGCIPAKQDET